MTVFLVKFLDIMTIMFAGINKIRYYFDNVMTKLMIGNRTDALKIDINMFCNLSSSARLDVQKQRFLFSWDSKWPPCDKGLLPALARSRVA